MFFFPINSGSLGVFVEYELVTEGLKPIEHHGQFLKFLDTKPMVF